MTKKRIVLIVAGGIAVLLVLGAAFLLFRGIRGFAEAERKLQNAEAKLRRFYGEDPFPSRENVARVRENADVLEQWGEKLVAALGEGQIEVPQKTPSTFMNLLSVTENGLVRLAEASGTDLPDGFTFGFGRYSAQGILPAPGDVPRLTEQLMLVDRLCRILLDERVRAITRLERETFERDETAEPEAARAPARRTRRPARRPARGESGEDAPDAVGPEGSFDFFSKQHFSMAFTAHERAVVGILNRLAAEPLFLVVTSVRVTKPRGDVELPSFSVEAETPGAVSGAGGGESPSRRERIVCGPEKAVPMEVTLELDVYRFAGQSGEDEEA
ncbi:MAG: Amuc_1100 family pilus-like protein [Lentisphaerae bacterium]|nr:Amuc_1100 family pilus-like protein [Lentisphaerota bacterium]